MKALLFDTETTGLVKNVAIPDAKQPFVIEFCGCVLNENTGEAEWHEMLIKPPVPISAEITEITGITQDMVVGAEPFAVHVDRLLALFSGVDRVVAHNLSFDRDIMDIEMRRHGATIEWPELVCTMEATAHWTGRWLNLGKLHAQLFGEPHENAHRARPDVEALVRVYQELRKRGEV